MLHQEIEIPSNKYLIKASLKIPDNKESKFGIVLAHGGIINRQSLIREKYSFGEYLCKELGAFIIAPDLLGDTLHKQGVSYNNFSEILNITTNYFVKKFNLNNVMGFGHSMGCFYLANSLSNNNHFTSIINYGGPIRELYGSKKNSFFTYLIKYLTTYNYSINIKNLINRIFDKETCIYLENTMLKNKEYYYDNYNFEFNSAMLRYVKEITDSYLPLIINWGKPALLLFGSNDGVTRKTLSYYANKRLGKNIQIAEIKNASHVTPCMDSVEQLSKMKPVLDFYQKTINLSNNSNSYYQAARDMLPKLKTQIK